LQSFRSYLCQLACQWMQEASLAH